jgi:glutathione S-transferase
MVGPARESNAMADLILHNFRVSPFSEKIRLVLGYKRLSWKSVIVPSIMPKPDVVALTGGYRKTPVLQIGADIYCDTVLICDVLEDVEPKPSLYPDASKGVDRIVAQWADGTLFWTAIAGPKDPAHMYGGAPQAAEAFMADRNAMFGSMFRPRPADAAAAHRAYLQRLAGMLDGKRYLFGDAPCIADFAAYHPLWFTRIRTPVTADVLQAFPALMHWMDRMQAIGHGRMEAFDSTHAIAAAAKAKPLTIGQNHLRGGTFVDDHGIALGNCVSVTAESFGAEVSEGELIAATATHYSLRRADERAGTVHVHFPRVGYVLNKVTAR